jgi:hypothetical protein
MGPGFLKEQWCFNLRGNVSALQYHRLATRNTGSDMPTGVFQSDVMGNRNVSAAHRRGNNGIVEGPSLPQNANART